MYFQHFSAALLTFSTASCFNFPFESIQLQDKDVRNFTSIAFGNLTSPKLNTGSNSSCRAYPGTPFWPSDVGWKNLNVSLSGALKPSPPGSVCYMNSPIYNVAQCYYLLTGAFESRFYIDDPLTVLTSWPQGNTCPASWVTGNTTCAQGGLPVYVVNATTVKHVQAAVNFARNKNLRLVIKNTGHNFFGRSTGAGSLSIWTHHLKDFEFLPKYEVNGTNTMVARVASGIEAWELYAYMDKYNMTLLVPGGSTVGAYGGWMLGGGHNVVNAYGKFVAASPDENSDLFYAFLGVGPGTFGIVTSAVVMAWPPIEVSETAFSFNGENQDISQFNFTPPAPPVRVQNITTFWEGVNLFFRFGAKSSRQWRFRTTIDLPGKSIAENIAFVQPLIDALNQIGIPVNNTQNSISTSWGSSRHGEGDSPRNSRFASRFFPRKN